jgi:hypothetical protein
MMPVGLSPALQEPWEEEGLGSFQIMIAVQQQQQRPAIPAMDQLPGQLGPAEAVAGYITLMQVRACAEICSRRDRSRLLHSSEKSAAICRQQHAPEAIQQSSSAFEIPAIVKQSSVQHL